MALPPSSSDADAYRARPPAPDEFSSDEGSPDDGSNWDGWGQELERPVAKRHRRGVTQRLIDARDTLAYRRLEGEPLTLPERAYLRLATAVLGRVLPKPAPLPPDVLRTVQDVLSGRGSSGDTRPHEDT